MTASYSVRIGIAAMLSACTTQVSANSGTKTGDVRPAVLAVDRAQIISGKMIAALAETNGVPGMGAAVWRNGGIVWAGSVGYRDMERKLPVDPDTIFRLASVSKLITATAAGRLKQDGVLDVDKPVASILPDLPSSWGLLTTRHLAAHISGLPHYQDVDRDRGAVSYQSVEAALAVFRNRDLLSVPGEKYSYSSWGYTLLSAVVEQSARRPFLDYVKTHITSGLRIVPDATDRLNAASKAYEFVEKQARPAPAHDYSYTWGGGGFGATPQALAQFGGQVMSGRIVSPETFEWMLTPATLADGSTVDDEDYKIGFGWRTGVDIDGDRIAHHAGVTIGARSALVLWPDQSIAVSLLSNALWVSSIEQSAMMLAAPFKPEPNGLFETDCPTKAVAYKGIFGKDTVFGTVSFAVKDDICVGEMTLDKSLREYFKTFPQKDAEKIRLIGLDSGQGLSRAALITPIGIYDLRALSDGSHRASLVPTRALSISFHPPEIVTHRSGDPQLYMEQIKDVIEEFRISIACKDIARFLELFLSENVTWQAVKSDRTVLLDNQRENRRIAKVSLDVGKNPKSFIESIVASPDRKEERFSNIKIDTDGDIASVSFDFTFHSNDNVTNRGKEAWQLVNTGPDWKIISVIYSINLPDANAGTNPELIIQRKYHDSCHNPRTSSPKTPFLHPSQSAILPTRPAPNARQAL